MHAGPSLYQLEKALQLYGEDKDPIDVAKWRHIDWVYCQLSPIAKALSYVGIGRLRWWKRTFIMPVLCRESKPYLCAFREGEWTKGDEVCFYSVFDFCFSAVQSHSSLFEEVERVFLSKKKPAFVDVRDEAFVAFVIPAKIKELTWKNGETYKEYRRRVSELLSKIENTKRAEPRSRIDMEIPVEPVLEESVIRWKAMMQQVPQLIKNVAGLLKEIERACLQARAIRSENGELYEHLVGMKKSVVEMLEALEMDYPSIEILARQVSQSYFSKLMRQEEHVLAKIRNNYLVIQKVLRDEEDLIFRKKEESSQLCRQLSKLLDCVPILPQENIFRKHQMRVLKEARDVLKEFRNAFARGMDIGMSFENFQQKILNFEKFARQFYDEGKNLDQVKEKLVGLEKRFEALPSQVSSARLGQKQSLCERLTEYRKTYEFSSQREIEFEGIEKALCALEK